MTHQKRRKIVRAAYKETIKRLKSEGIETTDKDIDDEIENIKRHAKNGTMDDFTLRLYCKLQLEPNKGRY